MKPANLKKNEVCQFYKELKSVNSQGHSGMPFYITDGGGAFLSLSSSFNGGGFPPSSRKLCGRSKYKTNARITQAIATNIRGMPVSLLPVGPGGVPKHCSSVQ